MFICDSNESEFKKQLDSVEWAYFILFADAKSDHNDCFLLYQMNCVLVSEQTKCNLFSCRKNICEHVLVLFQFCLQETGKDTISDGGMSKK